MRKKPSKRNVDGIWLRGLRDGSDSDDGDCDSDTVPIVTVIVIAVVTEEEESGKVVHDKPMRRWVGHELEIIRWSIILVLIPSDS